MYLNVDYIHKKGLSLQEVLVLQLIKQNKFENQEDNIAIYLDDEMLLKFDDLGYLDQVKKKRKSDSEFKILRTTKKANDFLDNCEIPEVDEDSIRLFQWVKQIYLNEGKDIGNQKKCKLYIAQFAKESGISRNYLAHLIGEFISDESEMEYSKRMEYLFFKGSSVFSTKFDLHQSRLYQYYLKNQEKFDREFEKIKN